MLIFDGNTFTIDGVTVFSDHADEDRYWYLPRSFPELARRGAADQPNFSLITYRPATATDSNVSGGGFLMLEAILPLPDDTRNQILGRLRSNGAGNPQLSPVPMDEGSVKILALDLEGGGGTANTATDGGFRFVENIMGATQPSMTGDNNALFSLNLSMEGAILMQRIFEEGASNVGVIYNFKYSGLRPALSVEITANFKSIYNHLSIGVDFGAGATINGLKFALSADIDMVFDELVQKGVIEIKVIDFSDATDLAAKETWALKFFKEELMEDWFETTLGVPKPVGETSGSNNSPTTVAAAAAGAAAGPIATRVTGNPPTPAAAAGGRPPNPSAVLAALGRRSTAATAPPTPGATAPPTPGATAPPTPGATAPPTPGATAPPTPGATAPPTPGEEGGNGDDSANEDGEGNGIKIEAFEVSLGFKLRKVEQIEDKSVTLRYDRQEAVQRSHLPQGPLSTLAGRLSGPPFFIEVDLNHGFFRKLDISLDSIVDYDSIGLLKSDVMLEYGRASHPAEFSRKEFSFPKGGAMEANHSFFLNALLDLKYRVGTQFHFDAASGWEGRVMTYDFPAEDTIDQTLLINPWNHLGFLEITILPGEMDDVMMRHTEVTLSYEGGGWSTSKVFLVEPDDAAQSWKLRLDDPMATQYSYSMVHHLADGTTRTGDSGQNEKTTLMIDDPFDNAIKITFMPNFDTTVIHQVFLDITYIDSPNNYERHETMTFSSANMANQSLRLARFDSGPEEISVRAMVMGVNNSVTRHATVVTSGPFVPLSELMV